MTRTRKWSLLSALLAVVVLLAGWFLLVSPKRSSASDLRTQAAAQESTNNGLQAQIEQLTAQKKEVPAKQAKIADVRLRIPSDPQLPALIRSLSTAATSAGVDVHSLSPVAPTGSSAPAPTTAVGSDGSALQVIQLSMEVDGTYVNVERFLQKVESLKRALQVTSLSLSVQASGTTGATVQAGQSPNLVAIIGLRAYMVSSATAPGTAPLHSTTPTTGTSTAGTTGSTSTTSTPAQ
jgi:Tfp pilus assembly protein PilO